MTPGELKSFRVERQLSQGSLAELLGVARTTLVGYEMGHVVIPKHIALAVAALFAKVAPYAPPKDLLRQVENKRNYRRIKTAVVRQEMPPTL